MQLKIVRYTLSVHCQSRFPVLESSVIGTASVHVNRYDLHRNFIQFSFSNKAALSALVGTAILNGLQVEYQQFAQEQRKVWGPKSVGTVTIIGSDCREAVDRLFQNQILTPSDRSDIEDSIREIEQSVTFSQQQALTYTDHQKNAIEDYVSIYLEIIQEAKLSATLIESALNEFIQKVIRRLDAKAYFENGLIKNCFLNPHIQHLNHKQKKTLFQALYWLTKAYAGMANLEGGLLSLGPSLPSLEVQQQIIRKALTTSLK